MAKPLNQRLATALSNDDARIADIESLIAEVEAERRLQVGIVSQAAADSVNFALSSEDRDAAAIRADRARREATALAHGHEHLTRKRADRRAAEGQREAAALRHKLLAERDEIAERLRAEWPAIESSIVALLSAVSENEAAMAAAAVYEPNAEAMARGIPGNFSSGAAEIRQLTKMALPAFAEPAVLAWPAAPTTGPHWTQMVADNRKLQLSANQRRAKAEAAAWSPYMVSAGKIDRITEVVGRGSRTGPGMVITLYPPNMDAGGPQHHRAWGDEVAAWPEPEAWDQMLFGLRLGDCPQVVATTTPKPTPLIRRILKTPGTIVTRGSTFDNAANLAESALEMLRTRYEGKMAARPFMRPARDGNLEYAQRVFAAKMNEFVRGTKK